MAVVARQFEQVAEAVAERTADLLCTRVWITDDRGIVVASSEATDIGRTLPRAGNKPDGRLRVPLAFGASHGEVVVAEPMSGEAVPPRLSGALVELMINQAVIVAELPNRHELKNKFIHDLLRGRIDNEADIMREGQMLGMDLALPRAVLLIDAADYILAADEYRQVRGGKDRRARPDALPLPGVDGLVSIAEARIPRRAQFVIASIVGFFSLPSDTICAYIGDGEVAVLKASGTQDLVAWTDDVDEHGYSSASWANLAALKRAASALLNRLRHDTRANVSIGIGRYHPGIPGLAHSYADAQAALSLGCRFHGHNQVHCLDGLGVAAFVGVANDRTKADLAAHLLSPLDQEPELHDTLHTFFRENCSASSTANSLCIHRNTLSYRLDKVTYLTGLDPRRFDDAVQIRLALLVRALQARPA